MSDRDSCTQRSPKPLFGSDESILASPPSTPRQRAQDVTSLSGEAKARVDLATSTLTKSRRTPTMTALTTCVS